MGCLVLFPDWKTEAFTKKAESETSSQASAAQARVQRELTQRYLSLSVSTDSLTSIKNCPHASPRQSERHKIPGLAGK